jgi:hypothetical protein
MESEKWHCKEITRKITQKNVNRYRRKLKNGKKLSIA